VPTNVANGSTIQLECGRVYAGSLDLSGKSNVTVTTSGTCGNATITPGQAIGGWTKYQGNIYSAPVGFNVAQVLINGQPLALAHWPSQAQTWAKAGSAAGSSLAAALPNSDVVGATLLFRANDWAIEARKVTALSGNTMTLASTGNISFDGYTLPATPDFYLEGKLWMLDEPGEWVVSNGRLYVWAPDGRSPEGRVFAAPDKDAINAQNAKSVTVSNVNLFASANGINGLNASGLRVTNVNITNASENGILNSGGSGLYVDGATILNARHDAIAVKWGGGGETIQNTTIDASGTIGMPTNSHAAINLIASDGPKVHNNNISRAGYIGVHVSKNASVTGNRIDTACLVLTDCGGIYVEGPSWTSLNTVIDGNTILNVGGTQKLAWAIDLDVASQVTITNNTISDSANGMQLHNADSNTITGNRFARSGQAHIQMDEDGAAATVRNNIVKGNTFDATHGEEVYRISSTLGAASVAQFASYDGNDYTSSAPAFANFNGDLLSFAQWKQKTGQDVTYHYHRLFGCRSFCRNDASDKADKNAKNFVRGRNAAQRPFRFAQFGK
jgi:parallel beta-helix repeat protein